jgi:glycosyltransferase involved in cell wall biosynthesis
MILRIGFLTERLLLGFGVDLVVHRYASFLVARGHDVTVYCQRHESNVPRDYKVVDISQRGGPVLTGSMSRNIVNFAKFFNACPVDAWVVNTSPFYEIAPLLCAPCVVIEYGTPPSKFFTEAIGRHLDASVDYRFRQVFPHLRPCDRILCISRSLQAWLPQAIRASSGVLYLGCDHYRRATECEARAFRQNLGVTEKDVLVLWVGRVQVAEDQQPYKGFPEFVAIAERVMSLEPAMKFVVVGRGGEAEAMFLRSRKIIACLNLADDRMGTAFAAADIFMSTTRWEGFNLPLLEAQFQGIPVLAYNHGPHPEVSQNGLTGLLVEDSESMTEQLIALSRDRERRARLASNTQAFAAEFSWERSCGKLERAINDSVARARTSSNAGVRRFLSGSGATLFVALDTYQRHGLSTTLKLALQSVRARILGAIR